MGGCGGLEVKHFKDLNLNEKKEVLKWRNSPFVAEGMYTPAAGEGYFESLDGFKIADLGVVTVVKKKSFAVIGLYKNPAKRFVGDILTKCAVEIARRFAPKIVVYVKAGNKKALVLYKKHGFKTLSKHGKIIKMELVL